MKVNNNNFFDLTYCSNIHAGETWDEVDASLKANILPLKEQLASSQAFGIGLRLSNIASNQILVGDKLKNFKNWLQQNNLYVMTINGFPYGDFHHQRVKEQVYSPDWQTCERRDYSLRLVKILSEITPTDGESGFSTSPLSYKPWLTVENTETVYQKSCMHICQIVEAMVQIKETKGKFIHIDIEPEPDCLIETIDEMVHFFNHWLLPYGAPYLANLLHVSINKAEAYLHQHVQYCYDTCHSAIEYENPDHVFKFADKAGIQIGKIQVSSALKCKLNGNKSKRKKLIECLSQFTDPVYLHQVIEQTKSGRLYHFDDLKAALNKLETADVDELRTHFHVPVFLDHFELLDSTQSELLSVLKLLQRNKATRHLEIETYTWDVLPPTLKLDMVSSIKREYNWVMDQF